MKDIQSLPSPLTYNRLWDFCEPVLSHTILLDPVTAHADAGGDTSATLVGVAPQALRVIGGYVAPSINSAGIDGSNTSAMVIAAAGTTVVSVTHEADIVANTPVALDTPVAPDIAAGSALTLAITNGATADLNSAICHAGLQVADANNYPAPGLTVVTSNTGTVTIADGVKGVCALSPGAADNDEIYMAVAAELHKFANGACFEGEVNLQWSEANTDDANVIFGFMSAVAANSLIDDGAGPRASGDYVALWKVDGGTEYYAGVQANGTAYPTADTLTDTTAGGTSYQKLKIKVSCYSSTQGVAEFWVDETNVATHHFTYASATEMQLFAGVKNGSANAETLNVDWLAYNDNRVA